MSDAEAGVPSGQAVEQNAQQLIRRSRWIGVAFAAFVLVSYIAISVYKVRAGHQGMVVAALTSAQSALIWIGFAVAMFFGTRAVELHRRFCRACRYERATGPAGEEGSGDRCPECGAQWDLPKRTVRGRFALRPFVIAIGVVIAIVPIGMTFIGPDLGRVGLRLTPTSRLVTETAAKRGFNVDEWAELKTRTLSREQKIALTEGLLAKREQNNGLVMDDAAWLEDAITQVWLPDDLRERFYRDMASITLDAPQRVRIGETFQVQVSAVDRDSFITAPVATVVIGGFFIGDDPTPRGRANMTIASVSIAADGGPATSITATEPGPLRLRFEYWLVAVNTLTEAHFQIRWNDDGTPVVPDTAQWSERRSVEHTVVVDP